jgi:cytochrome P450
MASMLSLLQDGFTEDSIPLIAVAIASIVVPYLVYSSLSLYLYGGKSRKDRPWKLIPGWIPVLGHFQYVGSLDYLAQACEKWSDQYGQEHGCFDINLAGNKYTVICRQDRAEELLAHRPANVERSTIIREVANSVGGTGVFTAEGTQWKKEHKLVAAALNRNHVQDYLAVFKSMTERIVLKWTTEIDNNEGDDSPLVLVPEKDVMNMSADAVAKVVMDRDFDFLNDPDSRTSRDIHETVVGGFRRALSPVWYWRIPVIGQYLDGLGFSVRRVGQMLDTVVKEQEEKQTAVSDTTTSKSFFVKKLYDLMKREQSYIDRDRVSGNLVTLFLAGVDTTSKTMTTALYVLAKDPQLQKELQREVDGFDLTDATLHDLYEKVPRVKAFFHEMHRFYGNAVLFLKVNKDIDFCGGTLRKGEDILLFSRYLTTSDKSQVTGIPHGPNGEPPSVFCSARYLVQDEGGKTTTATPKPGSLAIATFGSGVRACPGRTYSEALSYCVLIRVLQTFDLALPPDFPENPKLLNQNVMVLDCPVQLKLTKRKQ